MTASIPHTPAKSDAAPGASVRVEQGMVVIRIPLKDAHGLRVALARVPVPGAKVKRDEGHSPATRCRAGEDRRLAGQILPP